MEKSMLAAVFRLRPLVCLARARVPGDVGIMILPHQEG
jgi:hypothetical protein